MTKYKLLTSIGMLIFLSGCMNNGIDWSELSFTRAKPNPSDVVGTWVPTVETIKDLKDHGGYAISTHQLVFRTDGTFSMINMPDWWNNGFGQSKKGFESGQGKWSLYQDHNPWTVWAVELDFPKLIVANVLHLQHQKPPYLIHITLGDPDSGQAMIFERKSL